MLFACSSIAELLYMFVDGCVMCRILLLKDICFTALNELWQEKEWFGCS